MLHPTNAQSKQCIAMQTNAEQSRVINAVQRNYNRGMLPHFFALIGFGPTRIDATSKGLSNGECIYSLSLCIVEISLFGRVFCVGYYQKVSLYVSLKVE